MNSFTFKGVTYEVIPNGDHFTVWMKMVSQWSASKINLMLKQLLKSMSSIVRNYIGGIYKCPL